MISLLSRAFGRGEKPAAETPRTGKRINLALQGGGAHGAFTWGVLDQLLHDGRVGIDGISGTSAGAMNAVMLADGLARGGPDEARKRLSEFWRAVSLDGKLPPLQRAAVDRLLTLLPSENSSGWLSAWSGLFSPYDLNPLNINPLKDLIERFVDFETLRAGDRELFVAATNVLTGQLRIFTRANLSAEAVMASACLPTVFRAVEIDGIPYWDGGYLGNPVIIPFFQSTQSEDVLIVQINPVARKKVPHSNSEILSRVQEISFNSSLLVELRAIHFINRMIDEGRLERGTGEGQYRRINVHRIVLDDLGEQPSAISKLRTDYDSFETLRKLGQRATRRFLDANYELIGTESTIDIEAEVMTR